MCYAYVFQHSRIYSLTLSSPCKNTKIKRFLKLTSLVDKSWAPWFVLSEMCWGPGAFVVEHPVELEGEDAGLVGGRTTVRHTDLLCCLLELAWNKQIVNLIRIINLMKTFAQSLPIMRRSRCWCIEKEMVMIRRTISWWVFTRSRWEKKEAKMKKREIRQSKPQMIVVRTTGSDQNLAFLIISYQTSRWIIVAVIIVMLAHS